MNKPEDLTGRRFGELVCLKLLQKRSAAERSRWLCRCDCGGTAKVFATNLKKGNTATCGCRVRRGAHGKSKSPLYKVWSSMKHRCSNPNNAHYKNYGGRGVSVCDDWVEFAPFYKWAISSGYEKGLTLERKNNDGNYSPKNCTWIPKPAQSLNRRTNLKIDLRGEVVDLKTACRRLGLNYGMVRNRIKNLGWSIEAALKTPKTPRNRYRAKLITFSGKTLSIAEWAREMGVEYKALYGRLYRGSAIDDIAKELSR